ncbi:MAG TPA: hypothetical protein VKA65_08735 [Acidimicrobiales bacterium]|nr:hypothetical protein [Acidimicrobiales bacterium]
MSSPPAAATVTVARVAATSGWRRVTWEVDGPGWSRLADRLADPAALDGWVAEELAGTAAGHRDLAGALIVYRFAGSLAELVVGPLLEQRRALVLTPADVWLQLGPAARLDAVGVTGGGVAVLPDDPAAAVAAVAGPSVAEAGSTVAEAGSTVARAGSTVAGAGSTVAGAAGARPSVVVVDGVEGLRDAAVRSLLDVFGPLVPAVRARAPFGVRGMWGTLADHQAEVALRRAREQRRDQAVAWAAVESLLDALAAREPLLRARPRPHPVDGPAGAALFAAKGTCCLIYKAAGPGPARALIDAAACTSCPLRSEADRHARLSAHLSRQAGGGA